MQLMLEIKKFLQGVRLEFRRITWPTWMETKFTTIMIVVVATIMSMFFMLTDFCIIKALAFILGK